MKSARTIPLAVIASVIALSGSMALAQQQADPELLKAKEFFEVAGSPGRSG